MKQIREETKFICDRDSIYKLRCTYVYKMNMTIRDMTHKCENVKTQVDCLN